MFLKIPTVSKVTSENCFLSGPQLRKKSFFVDNFLYGGYFSKQFFSRFTFFKTQLLTSIYPIFKPIFLPLTVAHKKNFYPIYGGLLITRRFCGPKMVLIVTIGVESNNLGNFEVCDNYILCTTPTVTRTTG